MSVTTAEANRRAIQNNYDCQLILAKRHCITQTAVAKRKKPTSTEDLSNAKKYSFDYVIDQLETLKNRRNWA